MYEAPDRYKRMIAARLPGGESLGLTNRDAEGESSPLRDVQLISRAQLAPFFAAANIVAAVMLVTALWGSAAAEWLLPWFCVVTAVNLGAMQLARIQSVTHVGRSGRKVPEWLMIGDVAGRGLAHTASAEGVYVAERIAGVHAEPVPYDSIPSCTYCSPEIGSIGLTEQQAKDLGYNIIVFLAGLQGIPDDFYDAAKVDGAGAWQRFRSITLPLLQRTTALVLVLTRRANGSTHLPFGPAGLASYPGSGVLRHERRHGSRAGNGVDSLQFTVDRYQ